MGAGRRRRAGRAHEGWRDRGAASARLWRYGGRFGARPTPEAESGARRAAAWVDGRPAERDRDRSAARPRSPQVTHRYTITRRCIVTTLSVHTSVSLSVDLNVPVAGGKALALVTRAPNTRVLHLRTAPTAPRLPSGACSPPRGYTGASLSSTWEARRPQPMPTAARSPRGQRRCGSWRGSRTSNVCSWAASSPDSATPPRCSRCE